MVLGGSISKRVCAEEVAIFLADAVLSALICFVLGFVLVIDIAICIKDGLLTANTDNEPIPPDITFDTEADHATDIGTFIPVLVVFIAGVIDPRAAIQGLVKEPVMSLSLVVDKVQAHPEEATVESDVDTDAHLSMLFIQTRSIDELEVHCRNEFAVNSVQSKERTGLDQPGEVAVVKEAVVFRTVLDTGQSKREFQVKVVRELEVHTTVCLHDRGKGVFLHLVITIFAHVATVLLCNIHMQAPGITVRERTAQETIEVRHRFRNFSARAIFANHDIRQVLDKFGINAAKETTDRNTGIRIVVFSDRNGENTAEIRVLRVEVLARFDILRIRTEFTNQVIGVEVDVCRVIENAHIIHDVGRVLTHRFNTGKCCKCRPNTKNSKCGANRSYGF